MKSEQLKIQELVINGEVYAKYIVEGNTLHLMVVKDLRHASRSTSEAICCTIISWITGVKISHAERLNLIETES